MSRVGDAFYDGGDAFPLFVFLNDGAPKPQIVARSILFRKMTSLNA